MPIRNYGLKWNFEAGMVGQAKGGRPIDLSKQRGIYVIYWGDKIVYVGRSSSGKNPGIYGELVGKKESGKKFQTYSWFGVAPVNDDGELDFNAESLTLDQLTINLETLLIYLLDPAWNMIGGARKSLVEYHQIEGSD